MKKIKVVAVILSCIFMLFTISVNGQAFMGQTNGGTDYLYSIDPSNSVTGVNVGIGTAAPAARLHVSDPTANTLDVRFTNLIGTSSVMDVIYWDPSNGGQLVHGALPGVTGIASIDFDCGIGTLTITPTAGPPIVTTYQAWLTSGTTTGANDYFGTFNADDIRIATNNANCNFNGNNQRMIITNNAGSTNVGNVGIGQTQVNAPTYPQNKLLVENGDIYAGPDPYGILANEGITNPASAGVISASNLPGDVPNICYAAIVDKDGPGFNLGVGALIFGDATTNQALGARVVGNQVSANGAENIGSSLDVDGDGANTVNIGYEAIVLGNQSTNLGAIIEVTDGGTSGSQNTGVRVEVSGTTANENKGINVGDVTGSTTSNVGARAKASGTVGSNGQNIGVEGFAESSDNTTFNWGTEGFAEGGVMATGVAGFAQDAVNQNIGIIGRVISSPSGAFNVGAEGIFSSGNNNATNIAVYGNISGTQNNSSNYGVFGDLANVNSGATLNYAVHGIAPTNSGATPTVLTASVGATDYAGYFQGDVFCSNTYYFSDPKLKQDIKDYTNALDQLEKLEIKRYMFKHGEYPRMNLPGGPQIGVLSSNMKEVFPNMVRYAAHPAIDKGDTRVDFEAVNYTALVPVLVEAVQELNGKTKPVEEIADKVKEQDAKIATLTQQNADMLKQIAELKNLVNDICNLGCEGLQGSTSINPIQEVILYQSIPNPTHGSAIINYLINMPFSNAYISIATLDGKVLKEYKIAQQGKGFIEFENTDISDGAYKYSLMIDGKLFGTKSIVITKD